MPVSVFDPREDGYGGKYVRGSDFAEPAFLTIGDVNRVEFKDGSKKLALLFNDGREATLGRRNFDRLVEKWGDNPNGWIGHTVMAMAGDAYQGKPALFDNEADEAELLARRLNYPIRRYRLQLGAHEAGWQDITQ